MNAVCVERYERAALHLHLGLFVEWLWLVAALVLALFLLSRGGFGRLPGDVNVSRPGLSVRAPMATSCLVSIVLSVALSLGLSLCAGNVFR